MWYRQIDSKTLGSVDLVEQATVRLPVRYFSEKKGIRFEHDTDDLDDYEGAFFTLEEETPFALIHYRGNPENSTAIYLDRKLSGDDLSTVVGHILGAFELPMSLITWMHEE